MSLTNNGYVNLFPLQFIKECIEIYTRDHGKAPKVLVLAEDDYIDYRVSMTLPPPHTLGLDTITYGSYLKSGELDLAMAIKD